ncbi:MAG: aminotransferase class V-fold PLP-dependent enzyme, partial [Fimbriimonadaceae bacterium]
REGTLNTPLIVGFATAAQIARSEGESWRHRATRARDAFERAIAEQTSAHLTPLFTQCHRLPNTSSVWAAGVAGDALVVGLEGLAISYGSACSSGTPTPSPALMAFGLDSERASQTVRVSFGRENTEEDAVCAAAILAEAAAKIRLSGSNPGEI